jgi:hypothetical protein
MNVKKWLDTNLTQKEEVASLFEGSNKATAKVVLRSLKTDRNLQSEVDRIMGSYPSYRSRVEAIISKRSYKTAMVDVSSIEVFIGVTIAQITGTGTIGVIARGLVAILVTSIFTYFWLRAMGRRHIKKQLKKKEKTRDYQEELLIQATEKVLSSASIETRRRWRRERNRSFSTWYMAVKIQTGIREHTLRLDLTLQGFTRIYLLSKPYVSEVKESHWELISEQYVDFDLKGQKTTLKTFRTNLVKDLKAKWDLLSLILQ